MPTDDITFDEDTPVASQPKEIPMASSDPRDPTFGAPYTGSPVQQAPRQDGDSVTVLDMARLASRRVTIQAADNHYTSDGNLYHE